VSAPGVKAEIHGDRKAALDLHEIGVRASDMRPVSRELFRVLEQAEQAQFASGSGWPRLAEATLENKARDGYPAQILVRTGALRRALITSGGDAVRELERSELTFGAAVPYAKYALGTRRQPARPPIKLRPQDEQQITRIFGEYVGGGRTT